LIGETLMADNRVPAHENGLLELGNSVRLNEHSKASRKLRNRIGTVIGYSRVKGKLRVRWDGLKRPQVVQGAFLQLVDAERSPPEPAEVVTDAISAELEKIRDARFERHLKWPRQVPLHAYTSLTASKSSLAGYERLGLIGLFTVSTAIGAACFAFLAQ
jgi:hypothetical protein